MRSFIQSIILTSGTLTNSFLGLIFYVIIGRSLSVEAFGYFSFLVGIGVLAADIGDMGVNPSIVRFGHSDDFKKIITLAFLHRLGLGIVFVSIALLVQLFYPVNLLLSALVGWFLLLAYLMLQSFLARQQYVLYVGLNFFSNLLRIGVALLFVSWGIISVESALGTMIISTFAAFLVGFAILCFFEKGLPFVSSGLRATAMQMVRFGGFLGLSFSLGALAARIDSILVFSLAGDLAAGLYASAQRLSSIVPQVVGAIDGVFSPKLAKGEDIARHFRDYLIVVAVGVMGLLVVIPFTPLFLSFVFGSKYEAAAPILQVIFVGMALFFVASPFTSALVYRFGKTKIHFFGSLGHLALTVGMILVLVPRFGAMGAAVSYVIVQFLQTVSMIVLYLVIRSHAQNNDTHPS